MAKKRKNHEVLKSPAIHDTATGADRQRKLFEIIKEMALHLLKKPDDLHSKVVVEVTLLLAGAAWNTGLGDTQLRDRLRETIGQLIQKGGDPWAELVSDDIESLVAGLVEYKKIHFPDDGRRIVTIGMRPDAHVQVQWTSDDNVITARFGSPAPAVVADESRRVHPIAERLIERMKKRAHGKVVDLQDVLAGRAVADELQKTVMTEDKLAALHPAHAAYVYAQNQMSVVVEQLTALKEMEPFVKIFSRAEDLYMPSGPPMSPLTGSFFTCWSFFDACVGPTCETLGTTAIEVGASFGMETGLLRLFDLMQCSRMGFYVHEGTEGGLIVLREMVTDAVCRAVCPSGYLGTKGEIWYVRVLPPPTPGGSEHVVFTTPYVVLQPGMRDWQAYFRRTLPDAPMQSRLDAYESHMKYGPTRAYWNDFVFEAYANHRSDAVFLVGLPDVPESRPNSRVNS